MKIHDMQRRSSMTYARLGFSARIDDGQGFTLHVSRYDGETQWIVDGLWKTANSFPIYYNGEGSRCTLLKALADAEMVAALDEAATKAVA